MTKKLNKKELISILVEQYGYEAEDIKLLTNAKLEGMIKQEESDKQDLERQETVFVAKDAGFKDDDMILVMNGFGGALTHRSLSTTRVWEFAGFGQTQKLPYSELLSIRNNNPKVFDRGWLVVLNPQIQEDFGLTEMYKNILTPDNIDKVFTMSLNELSAFIDKLPEGMQISFLGRARELYHSGRIDSISIAKMIQEKFNVSFEDNAPLNDIVHNSLKKG